MSDPFTLPDTGTRDRNFEMELERVRQKKAAGGEYRPTSAIETNVVSNLPTKDELVAYLMRYLGDEVFARRFADCIDMIRTKNADYTQGTAKKDRIAAFRRISGDIGVSMEKVWAIFCQKHWGAVMRYVKDGEVESEPLDGRINDIINYMVLLGAIIGDEDGK